MHSCHLPSRPSRTDRSRVDYEKCVSRQASGVIETLPARQQDECTHSSLKREAGGQSLQAYLQALHAEVGFLQVPLRDDQIHARKLKVPIKDFA